MKNPILYRKRIIPEECIRLKDDAVLYFSPEKHLLVTKWNALKPKCDLHHGYSCYFYEQGFKISKFYRENGELLYWYCDIIDVDFCADTGHFICTDLLADIIIYPDGFVKVVDLDELTAAFDSGALSAALLKTALNRLNSLLMLIYSGDFCNYQKQLEVFETST